MLSRGAAVRLPLRRRGYYATAHCRRGYATAVEVWREVNSLAAKPGMINMGQGFPDFAGSLTARQAAAEALLVGSAAANQYSAPAGLLELREEVSRLYARLYPGDAYDPASEVVICTSGQESLNAALRACVSEQVSRGGRDGVSVFEPYFPFTQGALDNAPAVMQPVRTHAPGFAIDAAALRAAVTPRTGARPPRHVAETWARCPRVLVISQ